MKLKDVILNQFEPDIAVPLIEFGKSLSRINADVLVFMARKSLCLYDVLLCLGIPPAEQCVISDRALDMRLDPLVGKRVALIDDTLILGTTLAKTKRTLETEAKASVTVHVFCVNKKWWCRDLLQPDSIILQLDDQRLMTFCRAEVRAMSLIPRPYQVDFPISRPIRVRVADSNCLLSSVEWVSYRISTELQDRNGVNVFTFFPTEDVFTELVTGLGEAVTSCLDIVKIRAFARKHEEVYWVQLVPIVTLRPLCESDLNSLFQILFDRISTKSSTNLSKILYFAHSLNAQQRLVQYFLSAALGERFMRTIASCISSSIETGYDEREADRHYGPWLHSEMAVISRNAFPALWSCNGVADKRLHVAIAPASLPDSVREWALHSFSDANPSSANTLKKRGNREEAGILNLITYFTEIFLCLYNTREIPARSEVLQLGLRVLDATPQEAPNRDRLDMGIPWSSFVEHFSQRYGIPASREIINLLSLVLDLCNDLGIAVPITCVRDGVVFRAYRHGEDVGFSDAELGLAYEAVNGLLKATQRDSIPHLVLEKLLVLLIKVGVAKRFLEPWYGPSGVEGTVRIGFNLKGAVPILTRGPKDRADRNIWLSKYLLERQVLCLGPNGQYLLGKSVEGNYRTYDAPNEAYELGNIVGMLLRSSKDPHHKNAPLEDKALTILATCCHPRHAAAAVQVELDIFRRWYDEVGKSALQAVNWDDPASIDGCLESLIQSKGHEAIQSTVLKFVGYRTEQNKRIVEACAKFLEENLQTDLIARKWRSYWDAMNTLETPGEKERFNPFIDKAASLCWEIAACLSAIELAFRARLAVLQGAKSDAKLQKAFRKLWSYNKAMVSTHLLQPVFVKKLVERFQEVEISGASGFDHKKAFSYALERIESRMSVIAGLVETISPIIEEYGRLYGRHDYKYMLYYDIFDSTGTRAGPIGQDLEIYRSQIRAFKQLVNNGFNRLSITARKNVCEIYCWDGSKSSTNDRKHVFFGGKFARRYVEDVVRMLLEGTAALPSVQVRIYIIPCNFAGTGAYRRESDTEIVGERFWEHWSRLLEACSSFEKCRQGYSFLLVATEKLITDFRIPSGAKWVEPKEDDIVSEIEMLARTTKVRYGGIQI